MKPLVWFRSDLRVMDNPALHAACREAEEDVLAVFLLAPKQWLEHDWGEVKVGFILRTLRELSRRLEQANIPLLIRRADTFAGAPGTLLETADEHGCDTLYFNREHEVNERRRDAFVERAFRKSGRRVHQYTDQLMVDPAELKTGSGTPYKVFTPFKKAWLARFDGEDRQLDKPLPAIRCRMKLPAAPDPIPGTVDGFGDPGPPAALWPAGERVARKRMSNFIQRSVGRYHTLRDIPSIPGTSLISPYLSVGAVSIRQCLTSAAKANGGRLTGGRQGPAAWINELIWRQFYRHIMINFPRVSMNRPIQRETDRLPWNDDPEMFDAWREGRTGFPIVDAAMRQLASSGWMHNRLRMISAMFLTKDLFIDWRLGERHFMKHLIDGDLASNNGGWQWSASTGTDAAPYFRILNPFRQSIRFDSGGDFIRRYLPELAGLDNRAIHDPSVLPAAKRSRLNYPEPIVDHQAARLRTIGAFQKLKNT